MTITEKKRVHVFEKNRSNIKDCGRIDNGKHDLSCNFVGGTTIVGQSKPMTILEPVSGNHDEDEVLKFINELSKGNASNLIEPLWPISTDKDLHCCSLKTAERIDEQKQMVVLEPVSRVFPVKK